MSRPQSFAAFPVVRSKKDHGKSERLPFEKLVDVGNMLACLGIPLRRGQLTQAIRKISLPRVYRYISRLPASYTQYPARLEIWDIRLRFGTLALTISRMERFSRLPVSAPRKDQGSFGRQQDKMLSDSNLIRALQELGEIRTVNASSQWDRRPNLLNCLPDCSNSRLDERLPELRPVGDGFGWDFASVDSLAVQELNVTINLLRPSLDILVLLWEADERLMILLDSVIWSPPMTFPGDFLGKWNDNRTERTSTDIRSEADNLLLIRLFASSRADRVAAGLKDDGAYTSIGYLTTVPTEAFHSRDHCVSTHKIDRLFNLTWATLLDLDSFDRPFVGRAEFDLLKLASSPEVCLNVV
ncbi:hypothetical protein BDV93DRAFT_514560 [Ceratobasidium sp. AG-I]|nr:hypothetical protein BDV93DRAFT_514560 [Ceratobasidium sp. AG-I]